MFWIFLAVVLVFIFARSGRHHRRWRYRWEADERSYLAELQQMNEEQRVQIETLEARVARLEEGLEFAERLLAERASVTAGP